ncbi:MAG: energy transducer TonB [Bacteroidales bacterium]|nr:energy transducer TonB [Bacteroidales bacterium]
MSKEKKDRTIAAVGALVVHALIVLALFLMAFRTPLPLPGEEGVEVDLGMYNQGMGEVQPEKSAIPQQSLPPKPQENENVKSKDDVVTQDTEEAPSIKTEKKKEMKEETETKPTETPKEPEEPKPVVNPKALFKGSDKSQDGGSQGITGQPGDQGNPNGLAGINKYDGHGGQGNGAGYDLGGRGAKTLQRPSKDFPEEGHIVVEIFVDQEGNVVRANIAKGTDITNTEMRNMALEAARRSKFIADPTAPEEQKGTITYTFVQNQ